VVSVAVVAVSTVAPAFWSMQQAAAAPDTTAPTVEGLDLAPASVSTAARAALVSATLRVRDDLAGISSGGPVALTEVRLVSPGGQQVVRGWFSQANRISGNALDGTYRAQILVPQYSQPGRWAAEVTTWDQAGNDRTYTSAALAAQGFANGFEQTGAGDTAPPSVAAFSVSPASVDTGLSAQTISFSVRITDDLAGASAGITAAPSQVTMRGPTGTHTISATFGVSQRVSGSSRDGVYATSVRLSQWSEQGVWTVESLIVRDNVGNARTLGAADLVGANYVTTFTQLGAGDIVAPRFRNFTITPTAVDATSGPAMIVFRARLTDDTSGVAAGIADTSSEVRYTSPSGTQHVIAQFGSAQLTNGDAFDGWYEFATTIPPGAEQGAWTVSYARPVDVAHNAVLLDATEWAASGFPVSFDVRSDGTPSAPTSVHAVESGSTGATVSWLTPEIAGAGPITGYGVTVHRAGAELSGTDDVTFDVDGASNRATIDELVVGVTYTFTVQARNDAGVGARSAPSNPITVGGVADLEPPGLTALSISPVVVQTTSGPATVAIELGVSDDASGVVRDAPFATLTFAPPPPPSDPDLDENGAVIVANREPIQAFVSLADLVTGTTLSGSYRAQLTVPGGSELGNWTLSSVTIRDAAGRTRAITTAELVASGRPTVIRVEAALAPSAPRTPSATAGDSSATVSWLAPVDDGGSPITAYRVTSSPGGITVASDPNATSVVLPGLINGVSYSFSVVAVNAAGESEPSVPSNSVTPGALDETPPMLAGFSIEPRTHVLDGATEIVTIEARLVDAMSGVADQAPLSSLTILDPNGDAFATLELGPDQRDGTVEDARYRVELSIPADALAGRYEIGGVVVRDRAGNQATLAGDALLAAGYPDDFTLIVAPRVPSAPSEVSATAGDGEVGVSWLAPADAGTAPIDAYIVVARPTATLGGAESAVGAGSATEVVQRVPTSEAVPLTSTIVAGLVNGIEYTFTVAAENSVGIGPASLPSNAVVPNPPPEPDPDPDPQPDPTSTTTVGEATSTVPETTVPETTVPDATVPETTVPETTTSDVATSTSLPQESTTSVLDTTSSLEPTTTSFEPSTTLPETTLPDTTTSDVATSTSLPQESTTSVLATTSSLEPTTTDAGSTPSTDGTTTTTATTTTTSPAAEPTDQQPPIVTALSIAPSSIEIGASPRSVVLMVEIRDEGSGLVALDPRSELLLRSPSGILTPFAIGPDERVSGDATDGAYMLTVELGPGAEVGIWTVAGVVLRDAAGNQRTLSDADLAVAGFGAVFVVLASTPPAPLMNAPSPPHNVECREQGSALVVTWAAPLDEGSAPLDGYLVTASPLGARQSVTATHTRFSGLAGARAIRFTVKAANAHGTSAESVPSGPCLGSPDLAANGERPVPPVGPLRPSARA
jgi:hypothetical protein